MKLYDYTNLLETINEIDLEKTKLLNIQEMNLKNKCAELEMELLNSGILEDWKQLKQVVKKASDGRYNSCWYSMHQGNQYLRDLYNKDEYFVEYQDGVIKKSMGSGSCGSDYFCLAPNSSVSEGKVVWKISHTTSCHYWDGFKTVDRECKVKIAIMQALLSTYEEYRKYMLDKVAEEMMKKCNQNNELRASIVSEL